MTDMNHEQLQQSAREHLLLHFTRHHAAYENGRELLVLERGEGPYVFDTAGRQYIDALSSLFCAQVGYSYGEEMVSAIADQLPRLAFNTNWGTAHPPSIELAERVGGGEAGGADAGRPESRVLHQRRVGGGRGGVEDRPRALRGGRPAAAAQGDRAQHRLPRGHARRARLHRCRADEGRVRPSAHRRHPRLEYQRVS